MRRALLAAACAAAVAAAAGLGSGGPPADGVVTDAAAYARRGSLGADDYVATNVFRSPPYYALGRAAGTQLVERAMNFAFVGREATFALPASRLSEGYARALCLTVVVTGSAPCRVAFSGAARVMTADCPQDFSGLTGTNFFSFIEVDDGAYVVDRHKLFDAK